jgi:hypothetical protein
MALRLLGSVLGASASFLFLINQAFAGGPCVVPPATPEAIAKFRSNPQALVAPDSDTRTIEATVRDLAGTDPELAADFVRIASSTIPRYQTAIAAGLAQAAIACTNVDQHAGLMIQQAVAGFQDGQFQSAFEAVAGDLSTAATEAATASATSSVGSVVVVNPTSGGRATTTFSGGGSTSLAQITAVPATIANGGTSLSPTFTAATPVSPTR